MIRNGTIGDEEEIWEVPAPVPTPVPEPVEEPIPA